MLFYRREQNKHALYIGISLVFPRAPLKLSIPIIPNRLLQQNNFQLEKKQSEERAMTHWLVMAREKIYV